jgi:flagellar hook-associated protein 3 FlgL
MRIPSRTAHETMQASLQANYAKLVDAQRQLSTGKRLTKVSDAPADAVNASKIRGREQMNSAYRLAADDGLAMLQSQDSALQQASALMQRAKELMIAGSSDIESDNGRQAIASELQGVRDQLVNIANTTHDGRAVFGGYSATAVSNTGGVVSFSGDTSPVDRRVGEEVTVTTNTSAWTTFGFASGDSVFALINRSVSNVMSGNTAALRADLPGLDTRLADVTNALGSIGGRMNQIQQAQSDAEGDATELQNRRSLLEDVDMAAATVDLKDAEAAYEATLAVIARMQNVSLLDFLR